MQFKGQSALEYLTTYGWAIIIIGLALVALFELGVFSPSTYASQECVINAGFSCLNYFMVPNGLLKVNIEQSTADPINVTAVGCNLNQTLTNMVLPLNPPSNQVYIPIGGNSTFAVQCYAGGATYTANPGTLFIGYLALNYTDLVTTLPNTLFGKLSITVS